MHVADLRAAIQADLVLMVAAPDLLAACEQVFATAEQDNCDENIDWVLLAAAISKARGRVK